MGLKGLNGAVHPVKARAGGRKVSVKKENACHDYAGGELFGASNSSSRLVTAQSAQSLLKIGNDTGPGITKAAGT